MQLSACWNAVWSSLPGCSCFRSLSVDCTSVLIDDSAELVTVTAFRMPLTLEVSSTAVCTFCTWSFTSLVKLSTDCFA